jgi:hypothetical protein
VFMSFEKIEIKKRYNKDKKSTKSIKNFVQTITKVLVNFIGN